MADSKITALTALTAADPANDMMPIVDVSDTSMAASGTTKRISINNILACSPSATLASATITGDLTVDTSTLKVDSSNDRVGIGTATPAAKLIVRDGTNRNLLVSSDATQLGSAGIAIGGFTDNAAGYAPLSLLASSMQFGIGGSTAMTLNATGLGIGGSPTTGFLTVGSISNVSATTNALTILSQRANFSITSNGATDAAGTTINYSWANGGQGPLIFRNAAIANVMTLDASGNVGVGVTPSANKFQVAGNIGLPNSCTASGETSGVFSIDVANLLTLSGVNWRQASVLIVYSGIDGTAANPTILQTVVTLTGLSTWNAISKNDIVGTASVAVSNDTTTGARITVTVPTGNSGSVYAMLLGGAGSTTRPSMTINA